MRKMTSNIAMMGIRKTIRSRRACEYGHDEEHTGHDGYHGNNEPTQGV